MKKYNYTKKTGRPTDYKKEYCEEIVKFFNVDPYFETPVTYKDKKGNTTEKVLFVPADLPTLAGFAKKIGVSRETINEWQRVHQEFSDAVKIGKECQESILITNALRGDYNPAFSIFFAKNNMGWKDKLETDLTSKGEQILVMPSELISKYDISSEPKTSSK